MSRKRGGRSDSRGLLVVIIVFAILLGSAGYVAYSNYLATSDASTHVGSHLYTWSVNMTIQIYSPDNRTITIPIPSHIGQEGGPWLNHTLDAFGTPGVAAPVFTTASLDNSSLYDGHVYVSPTKPGHIFSISDFFFIWGGYISNTCMIVPGFREMCTGTQGTLYMEVNTAAHVDIANHGFLNGEDISINFFER